MRSTRLLEVVELLVIPGARSSALADCDPAEEDPEQFVPAHFDLRLHWMSQAAPPAPLPAPTP